MSRHNNTGSGHVDVLIFAGGTGQRMKGSPRPKQFLELSGKPIIAYTLDRFAFHPEIDSITIACLKSWMGYLRDIIENLHYPIPIHVVPGGSCGQESIFNGLNRIREAHPGDEGSIVLVHDGVRPMIDEETISRCIRSVRERGATAVVVPAMETIAVVSEEEKVLHFIERSQCYLARAPQGATTEVLWHAHLAAMQEGRLDFVDTVSLLSYYGEEIYTVEGPFENIKVTTPVDYYSFKSFMDAKDASGIWGVE